MPIRAVDSRRVRATRPKERQRWSLSEIFAVRTVYVDHYLGERIYRGCDLTSPNEPRLGSENAKCKYPVLRIFGRTGKGQSCLLHVHGCYPYVFVESPVDEEDERFLKDFHLALHNRFRGAIHATSYVVGIPFYGYHERESLFIKLEFYNPNIVQVIAAQLRKGAVMNRCFSVYESHLNFVMQFMSDYQLCGMEFIRVRNFTFRGPMPNDNVETPDGFWLARTTSRALVRDSQAPFTVTTDQLKDVDARVRFPHRQSPKSCKLEVDVHVSGVIPGTTTGRMKYSGSSEFSMVGDECVIPSLIPWMNELGPLISESQERSPSLTQERKRCYFDEHSNEYRALFRAWLLSGDDVTDENDQSTGPVGGEDDLMALMMEDEVGSVQDTSTSASASGIKRVRFEEDEDEDTEDDEGMGIDGNENVWDDIEQRQTTTPVLSSPLVPSPTASASSLPSPSRPSIRPFSLSLTQTMGHSPSPGIKAVRGWIVPREQAPDRSNFSPRSNGLFFANEVDFEINKTVLINQTEDMRKSDENYRPPFVKQTQQQRQRRSLIRRRPLRRFCIEPIRNAPKPWIVACDVSKRTRKHRRFSTIQNAESQHLRHGGFKQTKDGSYDPPLRIMCIEMFAHSRQGRFPDPTQDQVHMVCMAIVGSGIPQHESPKEVVIVAETPGRERRLFRKVVQAMEEYDPDMVISHEIRRSSLGYLLRRAKVLGLESFSRDISRASLGPQDPRHENDEWGAKSHSGYWLVGRIVINFWRVLRKQLKLSMDSLEHVVYEVLKERLPKYSNRVQQEWFDSVKERQTKTGFLTKYLLRRANVTLQLLDHLDLIVRTMEHARFLGLDFFSVLTRGSQYHVESVMVRVAKARNFVLPSPSKEDVKAQPALAEIALTLEPRSRMYHDPVLVLDFRSLYPSMIIAYNLCFSSFVGMLDTSHAKPMRQRLGVIANHVPESKEKLREMFDKGEIFITPNGGAFVKPSIRKGVLPSMLREILGTRILVKTAMNTTKKLRDHVKTRILDALQLSLKYVANVTYGYTSASYSGRMPCSPLADAIVRLAKETLQDTIKEIESPHAAWAPCKVVYGDTDSVFVYLPGRTAKQGFQIGKDIAKHVTKRNPVPVKLQFEKLYQPSILVAKKRYAGFIFTDDKELDVKPEKLDVKGLEIVRRDSAPIVGHIMEKALHMLFSTKNLSKVRELVDRCFCDIWANKLPINEFIIASKVRFGKYKNDTPPPSAVVARRRMLIDPMHTPLYKERVPYVVSIGPPNARVTDLVIEPHPNSPINQRYYIERQIIKPLHRLFVLVGVDVNAWWSNVSKLPYPDPNPFPTTSILSTNHNIIDAYLCNRRCHLCHQLTRDRTTCSECHESPQREAHVLLLKKRNLQAAYLFSRNLCSKLCDPQTGIQCESMDCPHYTTRTRLEAFIQGVDSW